MEEKLSAKNAVRVGKDLAFSTQILVDTTLALDDIVCEHMEKLRTDCIVTDAKYQVIMSVGNIIDIQELGHIPDHILVKNFVDQIAVLKEADVFLSHCGMSSVNESLYYKVPLVMYPQTLEQGGVAASVEKLGAGLSEKDKPGFYSDVR